MPEKHTRFHSGHVPGPEENIDRAHAMAEHGDGFRTISARLRRASNILLDLTVTMDPKNEVQKRYVDAIRKADADKDNKQIAELRDDLSEADFALTESEGDVMGAHQIIMGKVKRTEELAQNMEDAGGEHYDVGVK